MTRLNETAKEKHNITVLVPVRATIAVPIEVEHDDDTLLESAYGELHGDQLVDVQGHADVLEKVVAKAVGSNEIKAAIERLAEALAKHKLQYPDAKTYYTWYAGIEDEQEI